MEEVAEAVVVAAPVVEVAEVAEVVEDAEVVVATLHEEVEEGSQDLRRSEEVMVTITVSRAGVIIVASIFRTPNSVITVTENTLGKVILMD